MKKGLLLLLLSMALSSVASCHAAETETDGGSGLEESRADASRVYSYDYALSDEDLAERYADLSAKLYPYGEENAEQTISAEGLAYFTEIRDRYLEEYGDGDEEVIRMYDFMLEERLFFPAADGGLFAVYGYRMLGALCASYYDVFFLSASEETLLYSGQLSQTGTDFFGNGEKLMMISKDGKYGLFCIFDRDGQIWTFNPSVCEIVAPDEIVRVISG